MDTKVSVVIPTFNRIAVTSKCISSLLGGTYTNLEIIIADSDSVDGTQTAFRSLSGVTTLNVGASAWWTAAVNQGIAQALKNDSVQYILVINDDINIALTLIEELTNSTKKYPNKIISPAQICTAGIFLGINYSRWFKIPRFIYSEEAKAPFEIESSNGCCLLIPAVVFKRTGLFDEINCPHLVADVEFQIRAKRLGFGTVVCPSIVIEQHPNTDYAKHLKIRDLFSHKGSPLRLSAYIKYGQTMFNGTIKFMIFGFYYHYSYVKNIIKIIAISLTTARR
jgi:GT2 family glycosyltransferase